MLTSKNFKCNRSCAECCKHLTVKINRKEIEAIEKKGYNERFFIEFDDYIKSPVLRRERGKCVFLQKKKKEYYCTIYKIRPEVCRLYPFISSGRVESCRPNLLRYPPRL